MSNYTLIIQMAAVKMADVRLWSRGRGDILQAIPIVFGDLLLPHVYPGPRHAAAGTHRKQLF